MFAIAKETKIIPESFQSRDINLPELRVLMLSHPAFKEKNTHLESLASQFNINIIWAPKYHCEMNPIEGVWCYMKRFVRENNDQDFGKFFSLIEDSIKKYEAKCLNIKLWFRFWQCIDMYHSGSSYQEVLHKLFGAKSTLTLFHKKNKDFNNLLKE